jgi:hypothetical protein
MFTFAFLRCNTEMKLSTEYQSFQALYFRGKVEHEIILSDVIYFWQVSFS